MILLEDITLAFGKRVLLDNARASFSRGSLTALIGRNGSGKSTLLRVIAGLNDKYRGEVKIDGRNIRSIPPHSLASVISFVGTSRPRFANLTGYEVVALGRSPFTGWHGRLSSLDKEIVGESLSLVGMEDFSQRNFNSLSDGESQKIMIARAIAQDTPVILLDEPTSFLDLPTRYELVSLLHRLSHEKDKTIVYSTHELDIAIKTGDYIALIEEKKIRSLDPSSIQDPFSIFPPQ